ncbi:CCD84 protein, partial [Agelaius phoeniceus]|nr:CCD84 protein [Agelaius phoeniceus]NXV55036.1 CCD84 protein [Molothrus ater]
MAVHYCGLCRRSAFTGRRHRYSTGHRRRLREALAQLQEATAAARAAAAVADGAAAVRRYDPAEHDGRVWPEHRRETARFWRENRAEAALRERCLVPAEEYERFAQALEQALAEHQRREEERILQMAADIREAERRQRETVRAALQVGELYPALAAPRRGAGAAPRTTGTREGLGAAGDSPCGAEEPGPSRMQTGPDLSWMESSKVLTFIGHQETEGKGNVHTGAKPPWLTEEEDGSKQIGPSYEEFLKHKEKQKLKKLPVERVGANFDHTSQTSDSWLPSFGRVWNHGRRWQSR